MTEELAADYRAMELLVAEKTDLRVRAVVGGTHMQFLTRSSLVKKALPLPVSMGLNRKETRVLDYRLDEMGALHLSTLEPYVVHMGNRISPELYAEMQGLPRVESQVGREGGTKSVDLSWKRRVLQKLSKNKRIRTHLRSIYQSLFEVIFSEEK